MDAAAGSNVPGRSSVAVVLDAVLDAALRSASTHREGTENKQMMATNQMPLEGDEVPLLFARGGEDVDGAGKFSWSSLLPWRDESG